MILGQETGHQRLHFRRELAICRKFDFDRPTTDSVDKSPSFLVLGSVVRHGEGSGAHKHSVDEDSQRPPVYETKVVPTLVEHFGSHVGIVISCRLKERLQAVFKFGGETEIANFEVEVMAD